MMTFFHVGKNYSLMQGYIKLGLANVYPVNIFEYAVCYSVYEYNTIIVPCI